MVYDGSKYLTLYEDVLDLGGEQEEGKGDKNKKVYLRGIRPDYATIVPFVSDNEILMIKSYRHLVDSVQIEVPAGYIEKGETPEQAALRELGEETGYKAKEILYVGSYTLDYSMFEQKGHIFAAYGLTATEEGGKQKLGRMERIEIAIMPIEKINELLLNGTILNAASIVALYRALDYHKKYS
jgi:ADP-ribose diphosphatase